MSSQECQPIGIELVHLNQGALSKVLDDLDAQPPGPDASNRKYERYPCRNRRVMLCIRSAEQNVVFLVHARDISVGGISLMHGQMLYPKQRCAVGLPTSTGKWLMTAGQVVHCRHVRGMLHEVAIEFVKPLHPSTLQQIRDAAPATAAPTEAQALATAPA